MLPGAGEIPGRSTLLAVQPSRMIVSVGDRQLGAPVLAVFCQDGSVARKKTTVYIDETLLRATKVVAARSGKREYEVFEEAQRKHLGLADAVERIWAGISPAEAAGEEEATRVAAEELAAVRAERSTRRTG